MLFNYVYAVLSYAMLFYCVLCCFIVFYVV